MYKKTLLIVGSLFLLNCALGQCYPDRHSTSFQDGWYSCVKAVNPNSNIRPVSHWLMYDLGFVYALGTSKFWNANTPEFQERGIKKASIDYSLDGTTWTELGTYDFTAGWSSPIYEGEEGPDFEGIQARYLLLTGLESHGDNQCMGFSEWKIDLAGQTTAIEEISANDDLKVYPNPFVTQTRVELENASTPNLYYELRDVLGRKIQSATLSNVESFDIEGTALEPGHYFLNLFDGQIWRHKKLVFMNPR